MPAREQALTALFELRDEFYRRQQKAVEDGKLEKEAHAENIEQARIESFNAGAANLVRDKLLPLLLASTPDQDGTCGGTKVVEVVTAAGGRVMVDCKGCPDCQPRADQDGEVVVRLILDELRAEIHRQDEKHGPYERQSRLGVSRLALATMEDEVREALDAWRSERKAPTWTETRAEVLQVAAVAVRTIRDALSQEEKG